MGGLDRSILNNVPAIEAPNTNAPAIQLEQLCRHYRMGETLIRAVDGVTLTVRTGGIVALLGSYGSGKY